MPWLSKSDAAHALKISQRTLDRRIAAGRLQAKKQGRRVHVFVQDAEPAEVPRTLDRQVTTVAQTTPSLAQTGSQLAEVAASSAIQKKHDADMVAAATSAIHEARVVLENVVDHARADAERAYQAERQTRRTMWWVVSAAAMVVVVALGGFAGMGRAYYLAKLEHGAGVHDLDKKWAASQTRDQNTITALRQALDTEREKQPRWLAQAEKQSADFKARLAALRKNRDDLACALDDSRLQRDELRRKLEEAVGERDEAVLAENRCMNERLPLCASDPSPPPISLLKNLIDQSWTPAVPAREKTALKAGQRVSRR